MKNPFDLNPITRQNSLLGHAYERAFKRVQASGRYVLGPEVALFENEFARYCGAAFCVTVGSGTHALELALKSLNLKPGSQVATAANAGFYASSAILAAGLVPLYVDIDESSMTLSPSDLRQRISSKTKAVIATHLYGKMADMPGIKKIAAQFGARVVEDAAQAHGAFLDGKKAGTWGDIGCFSFYPSKNLGALGDGGAIVTNNRTLAARARQLRQHGWSEKYHVDLLGGTCARLDEIQAAFLRIKLRRLDEWNRQRFAIGKIYNQSFQGLRCLTPDLDKGHVCHLYVLRVKNRAAFQKKLAARGLHTEIHFPVPDYSQKALQSRFGVHGGLPVTERVVREIVTLPCFPGMTKREVSRVIAVVKTALG